MKAPLISVIIPVYKVEDYHERCLDSVINNTYKNLEIICVNDGSPDHCQEILERYAEKDNRIKVIVQENRGLSAARNTGIEAASGDYLYYLDSDDWIHKQAIALLVKVAEESDADIIVGGYRTVESQNSTEENNLMQIAVYPPKQSVTAYMSGTDFRVTVWGTLYRSAAFQNIRFPDKKGIFEDNFYHALIFSETEHATVVRLHHPLYYYYVARPDSIMKTATADTYIKNAKWLTQQLPSLKKKAYVLDNILSFLFSYSYASRFYANPAIAWKNVKICFQELRPHLRHESLSYKLLLKAFIVRYLRLFHRTIMIMRDRTYLLWEKSADKYKIIFLSDYNNL